MQKLSWCSNSTPPTTDSSLRSQEIVVGPIAFFTAFNAASVHDFILSLADTIVETFKHWEPSAKNLNLLFDGLANHTDLLEFMTSHTEREEVQLESDAHILVSNGVGMSASEQATRLQSSLHSVCNKLEELQESLSQLLQFRFDWESYDGLNRSFCDEEELASSADAHLLATIQATDSARDLTNQLSTEVNEFLPGGEAWITNLR